MGIFNNEIFESLPIFLSTAFSDCDLVLTETKGAGPIGMSKTKNQKPKSVFAFRHSILTNQSVKKMKSETKTRFRRRKRMLENQKTCSFFDVEKSKSVMVYRCKQERLPYIAVSRKDYLTPSCSTHNWLSCQKKFAWRHRRLHLCHSKLQTRVGRSL